MNDVFSLECSSLPDSARLLSFRAVEAISRPYEVEVHFSVEDANDFDLGDAVGASATLRSEQRGETPPFLAHGILSTAHLLHAAENFAVFRAVIVPRVWHLTQSLHSRVFTKLKIPKIIEAILLDGGLGSDEFTFRLSGNYEVEEHVCQYRESDLDFIQRWMELEGMYYFFEQKDDRELLVIADKKSSHKSVGDEAVRYHPVLGVDTSAGESFDSFTCQHVALPASVKVSDYNYANPTLDVSGTASVSATGFGEIMMHGERFFTPARGKHLASIRAEEIRAREVVAHATGTTLQVRAGHIFKVEEHPMSSYNTNYLAVEVHHFGNVGAGSAELKKLARVEHDGVYRMSVTAVKAEVQYRTPRRTAWPRIYGYEIAFIDGAADSEYAQIDDTGRYSISFKFDESDLADGTRSTWVRMMQPHGGGVEGWHFPLRKGVEVMVSFLGGDPDRPVISGVVPNAVTPSPVTSGNHTKNVIQTGGRNVIEMEDLAGSERMLLSTPHKGTYIRMGSPNDTDNLKIVTQGNSFINVGEHLKLTVGGKTVQDHAGTVRQRMHEGVDIQIGGGIRETCGQPPMPPEDAEAAEIPEGRFVTVNSGPYQLLVEDDVMRFFAKKHRVDKVKEGWWRHVSDGGLIETVTGESTVTFNNELTETIGGKLTLNHNAGATQTVKGALDMNVLPLGTKSETDGQITITAKKMLVDIDGDFTLKSKGQQIWNLLAEHQYHNGDCTAVNIKASAELVVGAKSENFVGGKVEIDVALAQAFFLGRSVEYKLGAVVSHVTGVLIDGHVGAKFETESLKYESLGMHLKKAHLYGIL